MNIGLHENELNIILEEFKKQPKIEEVILFGSRAKGTFSAGSDVDMVLKGENLELNDMLDLSIDLDNLDLPYKFDLIIFDRIQEPALLEHIERVGISIYSR